MNVCERKQRRKVYTEVQKCHELAGSDALAKGSGSFLFFFPIIVSILWIISMHSFEVHFFFMIAHKNKNKKNI